MAKISRDSGRVELNDPPLYSYGEKVRSKKTIRNDGTFNGRDIGDVLVKKGDEGYVTSIGSFLQQFYIYAVEFTAYGYRVGMKGSELESLDNPPKVEPKLDAKGEAKLEEQASE